MIAKTQFQFGVQSGFCVFIGCSYVRIGLQRNTVARCQACRIASKRVRNPEKKTVRSTSHTFCFDNPDTSRLFTCCDWCKHNHNI